MSADQEPETGRDKLGRFKVGHRFWVTGSRRKDFPKPEDLRKACLRYFNYAHDNPLLEEQFVGKDARRVTVSKMHAMTIQGLCLHIGISRQTWYDYAARPGYDEVCCWAQDVMFTHKFTGAAAGLLNPAIIAREIGLAEKVEQTGSINLTVSQDDANL